MGILNPTVKIVNPLGILGNILPGSKRPKSYGNDFDAGFKIVEIVDNREVEADQVILVGPFMPHVPFTFGGSQQIVKEYYAGSSEPTVQVLGPREADLVVRGHLKTKRLKDNVSVGSENGREQTLRNAAREYQELIDAMRLRGNLVKISLADEWYRFGFIESVSFDLATLADIKYEIRFSIVGFNLPKNCKFVEDKASNIQKPNKDVTNAAAAALAQVNSIPADMPLTLADQLNEIIGDVAAVVATVTNFVDDIITDAEQLTNSANRALGLIKYARAFVSSSARRVGLISLATANLGSKFSSEARKTSATIKNVNSIYRIRTSFTSLAAQLAALQAQFSALSKTVPLRRHLVRNGDNLQKLAIQYYNNADLWKRIYDHNKLRSSELTVGSVVEIPKV